MDGRTDKQTPWRRNVSQLSRIRHPAATHPSKSILIVHFNAFSGLVAGDLLLSVYTQEKQGRAEEG